MSTSTWYYLDASDTQHGPFEEEALRALLADGTLQKDSYVWRSGLEEWKLLGHTELASFLPAAVPAPAEKAAPAEEAVTEEPVEDSNPAEDDVEDGVENDEDFPEEPDGELPEDGEEFPEEATGEELPEEPSDADDAETDGEDEEEDEEDDEAPRKKRSPLIFLIPLLLLLGIGAAAFFLLRGRGAQEPQEAPATEASAEEAEEEPEEEPVEEEPVEEEPEEEPEEVVEFALEDVLPTDGITSDGAFILSDRGFSGPAQSAELNGAAYRTLASWEVGETRDIRNNVKSIGYGTGDTTWTDLWVSAYNHANNENKHTLLRHYFTSAGEMEGVTLVDFYNAEIDGIPAVVAKGLYQETYPVISIATAPDNEHLMIATNYFERDPSEKELRNVIAMLGSPSEDAPAEETNYYAELTSRLEEEGTLVVREDEDEEEEEDPLADEEEEEEPASAGTNAASDFEAAYEHYARQIRQKTESLLSEFQTEAAQGNLGAEDAAILAGAKAEELVSINNAGMEEMEKLLDENPGSEAAYQEWADKLYNVYLEESDRVMNASW